MQTAKRRRSVFNSLALVAGQGLAQLASAVTFLILARVLGLEAFGSLATLYGVALFLSILIEFGSSSYTTRGLSVPGGLAGFPSHYRSRNLLTATAVFLSFLTACIFPGQPVIHVALALAFVTAHQRYLTAPVRAALHMGRLAIITAFEKVVVLVVTYLLASFGALNETSFFLLCLISAVGGCCVLRCSWSGRYVVLVKRSGGPKFSNPYSGLRHLGLSSVAVGLQSLDSAAIAATAGPGAAGVYAAVGRWTQPLGLMTQAVTQSAYSEMAGKKAHCQAFATLKVNLGLLSLASIPLITVFIFAEKLTLFLLGPEYAASTGVLRLLVGAVLFGVVNSPFAALLQARGDEAFTSKVFLTIMPAQLLLMCLMALFAGPVWGAAAILVIQGCLAIVLSLRVRWLLTTERQNLQTLFAS